MVTHYGLSQHQQVFYWVFLGGLIESFSKITGYEHQKKAFMRQNE